MSLTLFLTLFYCIVPHDDFEQVIAGREIRVQWKLGDELIVMTSKLE